MFDFIKRKLKRDVSIVDIAKDIIENTNIPSDQINRQLKSVYTDIAVHNGELPSYTKTHLKSIAQELYYNESVKKEGKFYKKLNAYLKNQTMTLAERHRFCIVPDYDKFFEQYKNKLNLVDKGGIPVEIAYNELSHKNSRLFPKSITHPARMLLIIAEVYDDQQPKMVNPYEKYGYSKDDIIDTISKLFITEYYERKSKDKLYVEKLIEQDRIDKQKYPPSF